MLGKCASVITDLAYLNLPTYTPLTIHSLLLISVLALQRGSRSLTWLELQSSNYGIWFWENRIYAVYSDRVLARQNTR